MVATPTDTFIEVKDTVKIRCAVSVLFDHFIDPELLKKWWPQSAIIEPRVGGTIELFWFGGNKLTTFFSIFEKDKMIAYDFYQEKLEVEFIETGDRSMVTISHKLPSASTVNAIVHVAQTWSLLLTNLKSVIQHQTDLREKE